MPQIADTNDCGQAFILVLDALWQRLRLWGMIGRDDYLLLHILQRKRWLRKDI
ncbi:hypothetical protein Xhom_01788 [Xenorhabdus hominickii]|uniref:Uncharacterized protein n=1 Tax=Xenorhabdus hominickii TaxID=351679 RepID=A0A2G0QAQ7_XENHO|nr:hypothetical protein Xhom_01788 [Xenorhabdus hominickii]